LLDNNKIFGSLYELTFFLWYADKNAKQKQHQFTLFNVVFIDIQSENNYNTD